LAAPTSNVYSSINPNNQNSNATYDPAGNLRTFAAQSLTFDVENRLTASGSYGYVYDGDGKRVQKVGGANGTTNYVYDAFGALAAEYTGTAWTKDYVRIGGEVIATENAATTPCKTCYFSVDHLGSTRMVTDQNHVVISRHDYAPFGQEILSGIGVRTSQWGASDSTTEKFTGKERDSESGLDYFGARYYGSALG
jgi:hypothetical protein